MKLSPSLLSADYWNLESQITQLENIVDRLHIDVMDGHFVPNISIGVPVVKSLKAHTNLLLDVHLMIENPEKYIDTFISAGSDILTFHIETTKEPTLLINQIKSKGIKAGIAIRPSTPLDSLLKIIDQVDQVTIMTVEPGFGGQKFIPEMLERIKELSKYGKTIEIDGGVTEDNIKTIVANGAEIIVAGTAIFKEKNIKDAVQKLNSLGGGNN